MPMPSILDIAPPEASVKEVNIRGTLLPIRGVSAIEWANLYGRFPDLRNAVEGKPVETPSPLVHMTMMAAVIATGLGHAGQDDIERAVLTNLTFQEASTLMQAVITISLPGAVFGPLLGAAAPSVGTAAIPLRKTSRR